MLAPHARELWSAFPWLQKLKLLKKTDVISLICLWAPKFHSTEQRIRFFLSSCFTAMNSVLAIFCSKAKGQFQETPSSPSSLSLPTPRLSVSSRQRHRVSHTASISAAEKCVFLSLSGYTLPLSPTVIHRSLWAAVSYVISYTSGHWHPWRQSTCSDWQELRVAETRNSQFLPL